MERPEYMLCMSQCRARNAALRLRRYFTNTKPPIAARMTTEGTASPTGSVMVRGVPGCLKLVVESSCKVEEDSYMTSMLTNSKVAFNFEKNVPIPVELSLIAAWTAVFSGGGVKYKTVAFTEKVTFPDPPVPSRAGRSRDRVDGGG